MDKIWYRNPSKSEVIGRCCGDEKKRMTTQKKIKIKGRLNISAFIADSRDHISYFTSLQLIILIAILTANHYGCQ